MKRELWTGTVTKDEAPEYPCPTCKSGVMSLIRKTATIEETAASKSLRRDPDWDPEWMSFTISVWLECANRKCRERMALVGDGRLESVYYDEQGEQMEEVFVPKCAIPMPDVFAIPENCPETVEQALRSSFATLWINPSGCANGIRTTVERLLDSLGVAKVRRGKGRQKPISLHQRILNLSKKYPDSASHLMAIKWLANEGSHDSEIGLESVLDAYEVLEHVLDELLISRRKRIDLLARRIQKRHAPRLR